MKWNATRFNTFCARFFFSECSSGLRLCTSPHRISFNANNKPCREWQDGKLAQEATDGLLDPDKWSVEP